MEISDFIRQEIQISHNNFVLGDEDLVKNNQVDLKTVITLALPSNQCNFKVGDFEIIDRGKTININISKILNKNQDPIFLSISHIEETIGIFHEGVTKVHLPLEMYTDNIGKYPYYCAKISFPYRLTGWIEKKEYDYDREQITGGHKDKDKVEALFALNKLFQSGNRGLNKALVYEDVTLFIEDFLLKQESKLICRRIVPFASANALKDVINSFLGFNGNDYIAEIIEKQRNIDIYPDIRTENDLLKFVVSNIETNIIHYIENQYLIQAFWNNGDKGKENDRPKTETNIQRILYFLLQLSLLYSGGIQVVRESDEGVGKIDFKFLYTTPDRKPLAIYVEFKLAHNKEIERGITKQLPTYIRSNRSTSGIYAVMWFKDGKIFKQPTNRTKTEMKEYIREKANEVSENQGLNIKALFIDASIRETASKL